MTENEAIKILKKPEEYIRIYDDDFVFPSDFAKAYETAIKALEEIQRYKALEEKLNGISVEQVVNGFISTVEKQTHEEYKRGRILTNKEADEWNELQAIGTVEEIQSYRAIGTPTQILEKIGGLCVELGKYACIGTVEELRNLQDQYWKLNEICKIYSEIGTVEEFKALKEKSVAKKVVYVSNIGIKTPHCPNCNIELTMSMHLKKFCNCGQKLDWQ